jgi:hypothetical protein
LYIKSHNIHGDIENSRLSSPKYVVHAIVNDDPDANKLPEGTIPYGNKLYVSGSVLEGDIVNEDIRSMSMVLDSSTVRGGIQNVYVKLVNNSAWYATADSSVALVDCTDIAGIDAPGGVTIQAFAAQGTTLSGTYDLPSGGKLIVG